METLVMFQDHAINSNFDEKFEYDNVNMSQLVIQHDSALAFSSTFQH